jgi:hypothetical protein
MYLKNSIAIAILAVLGQATGSPLSTLPTVDLGYEIHQALYFDVSPTLLHKMSLNVVPVLQPTLQF